MVVRSAGPKPALRVLPLDWLRPTTSRCVPHRLVMLRKLSESDREGHWPSGLGPSMATVGMAEGSGRCRSLQEAGGWKEECVCGRGGHCRSSQSTRVEITCVRVHKEQSVRHLAQASPVSKVCSRCCSGLSFPKALSPVAVPRARESSWWEGARPLPGPGSMNDSHHYWFAIGTLCFLRESDREAFASVASGNRRGDRLP